MPSPPPPSGSGGYHTGNRSTETWLWVLTDMDRMWAWSGPDPGRAEGVVIGAALSPSPSLLEVQQTPRRAVSSLPSDIKGT